MRAQWAHTALLGVVLVACLGNLWEMRGLSRWAFRQPMEIQMEPQQQEIKMVKKWCSDECGEVTVTTCCGEKETRSECVKRHREAVEEMMKLCPEKEETD